ncbi:hypothetical protein MKW94_011761 [Papaver nudicaule]|uniref:Uncharacterized protein n=1 Tax=Papaver nudicaule TaxID=74823 RepID=A0AA41V513_PAPNU|nr:hypothetical protein [Papaver nudicaule]
MARSAIISSYTSFFFVLMVIYKLQGKGDMEAANGLVTEERTGKLKGNTENVGLRGKTTGSRNIGNGLVKEDQSVKGKGNLQDLKGKLNGKEKVNVADGLVTGNVKVRPRGNLKDGTLKVTGTGSVGVAGEKQVNLRGKTQMKGSRSFGKAGVW